MMLRLNILKGMEGGIKIKASIKIELQCSDNAMSIDLLKGKLKQSC